MSERLENKPSISGPIEDDHVWHLLYRARMALVAVTGWNEFQPSGKYHENFNMLAGGVIEDIATALDDNEAMAVATKKKKQG